ncbi:MAG: hypothetical protein ACKO96_38500, partial [Flammeovirgaceae bacterium]
MVVIDKKLVNKVRELIFDKDATELSRTSKRKYKGVDINHKILEYRNERGRTAHMAVPVSAIKFASERGAFGKYEAIKTTEPVKMWNRNFQKWLYRGGDYTTDEIRQKAQQISDKFAQQGKQGVISVSVKNWGDERGVWRAGKLKPFGDR